MFSVFERRPRVADVAARAGVSTATVERVINGRGGVHQKTVARVEEAIRAIVGTRPAAGRRRWQMHSRMSRRRPAPMSRYRSSRP